ncbi:MAG: DUF3592 domain-containing protein, partial [Desulfobacteraceae bacterium]
MKWVIMILLGSLGLAVLVYGLMWGAKRFSLLKDGLRTQGKVVKIEKSLPVDETKSASASYYPIVEFQDRNGATIRFKGSTGSNAPAYETGVQVPLVYNPRNPSEAQLTTFSQFWLGPLLITLAGLGILFLSYGAFSMMGGKPKSVAELRERMLNEQIKKMSTYPKIEGRISDLRKNEYGNYVLICRGTRPGAVTEEEFQSGILNFNPGPEII